MSTIHPETPLRGLSLLGFVASGDLGAITCYRSHLGAIIQFAKTWPKTVPSLAQLTGRCRMHFAAEQWRHFTDVQKQAWRNAARISHLCMHGYDLWVRWFFHPNYYEMWTLINQTDVNTLANITRSDVAIPPAPKFQPHELADEITYGRARYGRRLVIMPPQTSEYLPFLAVHHGLTDGSPVLVLWSHYGPGLLIGPTVQNNHWCAAEWHSTDQTGYSQVHCHMWWPDGSYDIAKTDIYVHVWPT
jgi:hypothetical protein